MNIRQHLFNQLKTHFGTNKAIAEAFAVSPPAVQRWQDNGVPENIAQIASHSNEIAYCYHPSHFSRDTQGLTFP
ncbi:hypothetical protein AB6E53_02450 [Vibrio breoganii]|uniref:Uncharacterized protein n=1 Tax=Vibrio breoganii TaxID=553239 RepID=A0AAP8MWU1_9VIBR|nr:hypothetical protein [Vibrio breoganii]PMP10248.1 hypothetical protein BCS93_11270 [Vibrio breoganii]